MDKRQEAFVFGIDPGVRGGFALVRMNAEEGAVILSSLAGKFFHREDDSGMIDLRRRNIVRAGAIRFFIMECCIETNLLDSRNSINFVIERQHARVSQGANGQIMFNYGRLVEQCEIELETNGVGSLFIADPSKWKPQMGLSKDKSDSIRLATEIFGVDCANGHWPRKGDDGVAEAALLAFWRGKRILS